MQERRLPHRRRAGKFQPSAEGGSGVRRMPVPTKFSSDLDDLRGIAYAPCLRYPIATKAEFVAQLSTVGSVTFRRTEYQAAAANLIPAFFFPVPSADELVERTMDLLVARGLAAAPESARPALPPGPVARRDRMSPHLARIVARIELSIAQFPPDGRTDVECIHALDVLTHALDFVDHPEGLSIWREALWKRRLHPDGYRALTKMLEHLQAEVALGHVAAASEICDCLEDLVDPDVTPRPRVGGLRRAGVTTNKEE